MDPAAGVFLILLLLVVVFALLARKLRTPYPIVLVTGGLLLSLLPRVPEIRLKPELIFTVVLPPLLYSAAWTTSWHSFRHNLVSIISLAVGLVSFSVAGVALAGPYLFPGFDWRPGLRAGRAGGAHRRHRRDRHRESSGGCRGVSSICSKARAW